MPYGRLPLPATLVLLSAELPSRQRFVLQVHIYDGDHTVRSINDQGEDRGPALATHNTGSCHGSIFPFLFLPSLPPAVAPAAPNLPLLLLDYSCTFHVRIGVTITCIYLRLVVVVVSILSYALTTTVGQAILSGLLVRKAPLLSLDIISLVKQPPTDWPQTCTVAMGEDFCSLPTDRLVGGRILPLPPPGSL